MPPIPDTTWLPEHQHHVAYTLAHADSLIERVGVLLYDYLTTDVFGLETVPDGELAHVKITRVEPLPTAVARTAADALTQLRAAVEHTLFAEVVHRIGRALTDDESRRIEVPACLTADEFAKWTKGRRRQELDPLHEGAPLLSRLRDLQPFQRRDSAEHPLKVLTEHTNLAKHRTPSVATTRLGAVIPDHEAPNLIVPGDSRPIAAGDVIATGPLYERVPISIWPTVSIRRPHTRTWHVVMKELGQIEEWARTIAVPHLILGRSDVDPLPPQLDTSVGHDDFASALQTSGSESAAERSMTRIQATMARESLVETLALDRTSPDVSMLREWVTSLDDAQALERQHRLSLPATARDFVGVTRVVGALLDEARSVDRRRV